MYDLIDACDFCGEFHRVMLYEVHDEAGSCDVLTACDTCLDMLYEREELNDSS